MAGRSHEVWGTVLCDSQRGSFVLGLPAGAFIQHPPDECRSLGPFEVIATVAQDDIVLAVDRLVTCVMVAWAVTIFVGMSYLAAII
jgi:hypothetical protein